MNLLLDLQQMAAILDFLPTMQCLKYVLTTPLCAANLKNLMMDAKNTNLPLLF